ncbi:hypothetical protein SAMN05216431_12117 [Ligilactobacillus sp. WC1T17]|uniref:Uncharacterized protein n=1 Tax=Ligilactobacillus ruminis TaxID=1623 RepID=A0ABY1AEZ4_9LACO|nr:hypothetical protein SAMN05216431_12117 [Ligilactobacillus ruminis]
MYPSQEMLEKLDKAVESYENKFGKGAFDHVVPLGDPLTAEDEDIAEGIETINQAILMSKRLPELDPDSDLKPIY